MKPIFCRECRGRNSFDHKAERDAKTESGRVCLECWECRVCGHIAWAQPSSNHYPRLHRRINGLEARINKL